MRPRAVLLRDNLSSLQNPEVRRVEDQSRRSGRRVDWMADAEGHYVEHGGSIVID